MSELKLIDSHEHTKQAHLLVTCPEVEAFGNSLEVSQLPEV